MRDRIKLFVGTDERQERAEHALEESIRAHTTLPVDVTWMRAGDPGFQGWCGQPDQPLVPGKWATRFTNFRYAVPALAEYKGRAIYLDSDMIVLGNLKELWHWRMEKPWHTISTKRTDVSIINCAAFKHATWWPRLEAIRMSERKGGHYRRILVENDAIKCDLPQYWDHMDQYQPGWSRLVHYTWMPMQPWKPWPEAIDYVEHRDPRAVELWEQYANLPSKTQEPSAPASESPSSATPPTS